MSESSLDLRPVSIDNYYQVMMLALAPDQVPYLWSNAGALAEAAYVPDYTVEAVHADGELVGLVSTGGYHPGFSLALPAEPGSYIIDHLMIAAPFQGRGLGRGLGRRLIAFLIARLSALPDCRRIVLGVHPENKVALALYAGFGFRQFGVDHEGYPLLELAIR